MTIYEAQSIFEVKVDTLEALKIQYKVLIKRYHPDVIGNTKEANDKFSKITLAHEILEKYLKEPVKLGDYVKITFSNAGNNNSYYEGFFNQFQKSTSQAAEEQLRKTNIKNSAAWKIMSQDLFEYQFDDLNIYKIYKIKTGFKNGMWGALRIESAIHNTGIKYVLKNHFLQKYSADSEQVKEIVYEYIYELKYGKQQERYF